MFLEQAPTNADISGPCLDKVKKERDNGSMRKIQRSWWDRILDGKLHHIDAGNTPYGSAASLRSAIYREAGNLGRVVSTSVDFMQNLVYVQAWQLHKPAPERISGREHESTPGPDPLDFWIRPTGQSRRAKIEQMLLDDAIEERAKIQEQRQAVVAQAQAQVAAAGLDAEDQDLIEERLYCSCGIGNATGDQRHDPSCKVWG